MAATNLSPTDQVVVLFVPGCAARESARRSTMPRRDRRPRRGLKARTPRSERRNDESTDGDESRDKTEGGTESYLRDLVASHMEDDCARHK